MSNIEEDLKKAIAKRDERTILGIIIGFFVGFLCGIDGLIGIVGAAIGGYIAYTMFSGEVEDIKKIQEIKK